MFISWTKYFTIAAFFFRKENHHKNILYNTLLSNLVFTGPLGKALNFHLNYMFASFPFHSVAYFLEFLETFIKSLPWQTYFTHFTILIFLNIAWGSATFLHFECVALNYVITVLHFDESSHVSDTLEEPNYFDCIIYLFLLFFFAITI